MSKKRPTPTPPVPRRPRPAGRPTYIVDDLVDFGRRTKRK